MAHGGDSGHGHSHGGHSHGDHGHSHGGHGHSHGGGKHMTVFTINSIILLNITQ